MTRRGLHRALGVLVVPQLVVWLATGVLFNVKHRYDEAYETLAAPPAAVDSAALGLSPAEAARRAGAPAAPVTLRHDAFGYAYAIAGRLIDAATGAPRVPADEAAARRVLGAALADSKHRARYGPVVRASRTDAAWAFDLETGQRVTVDPLTAAIDHRGPLHEWIDWTYRAHYMQYTPSKPWNIAIVMAWVALSTALAASGLTMVWRRKRGQPPTQPMKGRVAG